MNTIDKIKILISEKNDSENDIVPSNKLAFESNEDLENELSRFRSDWKRELGKENVNGNEKNNYNWKESSSIKSDSNDETKRPKNIAIYNVFQSRPKMNLSQVTKVEKDINSDIDYDDQPQNNEQKAQYLFNKGVQLEQQNRHYEGSFFAES